MPINYTLYEGAAGAALGAGVETYVQTGSASAAAGSFVGALVVAFGGLLGWHGLRSFLAGFAAQTGNAPAAPPA